MNALEPLFARLARSTFRSRFRLGIKERQYCWDKGAEVIDKHAADFIAQRLAPAHPANDGKQTPMRGHPVFIAQHATATCDGNLLSRVPGEVAPDTSGRTAERSAATVYCQRYPLLAGHTNESAVEQRVVADAFPDKLPSYH